MYHHRRTTQWLLAGALYLAVVAPSQGQTSAFTGKGPKKMLTITLFEMHDIGGGWGLATVIQTPRGAAYVYDAGTSKTFSNDLQDADVPASVPPKEVSPAFETGRDAIGPYLSAQGVSEIAGIVVSHPHSDHYGGAFYLVQNFTVRQFLDSGYDLVGISKEYRTLVQRAVERGGKHKIVHAGDRLDWGPELEVEALSPPKGFLVETDLKKLPEGAVHDMPNYNSLVLRVRHGKNVFLFPGDLTTAGQDYLLKRYSRDKLATTVLVAPGHGTAAYLPFAEVAKPRTVVVSCLTTLPFPAEKAQRIYSQVGAQVYANCWNGRIQIVSDGENYVVKIERDSRPKATQKP